MKKCRIMVRRSREAAPEGGVLLVAPEGAPEEVALLAASSSAAVPDVWPAEECGRKETSSPRKKSRRKAAAAGATSAGDAGDGGPAVREEARDIFPPRPGRPAERPSPVMAALELLSGGHSDLSAVRYLREGHNLSLEQAQAAVETAYQKLEQTLGRGTGQRMALAVEQRCRIAAAAMDQSDYRIALSALEQRDRLLGLTGPEVLGGNAAAENLLQLLQQAGGGANLTGGAVRQAPGGGSGAATEEQTE